MLRAAIPEELSLSQPLALLQQLASLAENMGGSSGGEQWVECGILDGAV